MDEKKCHQIPMTVNEQLKNLKLKQLIIEDEENARSFLNDVSYFRLVKAYSLGLKEKNHDYFENVTFEQIKQLYLFNAKFRQALFPQIEIIEVNLRCRISNYFSNKYGVLGYEDSANFRKQCYHEHFMNDIQGEINRNSKAPLCKKFSRKLCRWQNTILRTYRII